jgi:hypothetical protein
MTQTNDQNFSPALVDELFTQFLNAPNKCETTSEIPTQPQIDKCLQEMTPLPLFPIPSIEPILLTPNNTEV